jgi:hypothetical protein
VKGKFQTRIYSFSIQSVDVRDLLGAVHTRAIAAPSMSFSTAGAEFGCILIIHSLILLVMRSGPGVRELVCLILHCTRVQVFSSLMSRSSTNTPIRHFGYSVSFICRFLLWI